MSIVDEVRVAKSLPAPPVARAIRKAAGVSQQRLADELGARRNTVSRWENGERKPSARYRAKYAELLRDLSQVA